MNSYWTEYIRLLSYSIVIWTSIVHLLKKNTNPIISLSNIIMAISLTLAVVHVNFFKQSDILIRSILLTPFTLVWALLHVLSICCFYKRIKN
jgi:hypothetical protein